VVATRPNKPPAGAWWRSINTITKFERDVIVKMEMPSHLDNFGNEMKAWREKGELGQYELEIPELSSVVLSDHHILHGTTCFDETHREIVPCFWVPGFGRPISHPHALLAGNIPAICDFPIYIQKKDKNGSFLDNYRKKVGMKLKRAFL